tara:strand:- start:5627 stop:5971 length:345 start_codon:yes stop_codon:yes gene_type:complete
MYIINDIWKLIKEYLFHNIKKQGKHLKNDKYIHNYNNILKTLPKMYIPRTGPRIVYNSFFKTNFRIVKFLYHINHKTWKRSKTIIEYASYIHYYCVGNDINHSIISEDYRNNIK